MLRKPHIIVLDDDRQVCRIIEKVLRVKGFAFEDAKQLIDSLEKYSPQAAFIDIHLGLESSGLDVIPILRNKWPYCPIIVITSDTNDNALKDALITGADDVIRKPINETELITRVSTRIKDQEEKRGQGCLYFEDIALDKYNRIIQGPLGKRYLSQTEVNLIVTMMKSSGNIVSRETLAQAYLQTGA